MQIESWSLRKKATATFTDDEWKSLTPAKTDYVAVKVLEVNEEEGAYSVLEVVDGVEYINELYDDEENIYLISTGDSIREK